MPDELTELSAQLSRAVESATDVLDELREIARGIHPAILTKGGLAAALHALARRCPIPVHLETRVPEPLAEHVAASASYVVAEALTNVAEAFASVDRQCHRRNQHRQRRTPRRRKRRWHPAVPTSAVAPALSGSRIEPRQWVSRIFLDSPLGQGTSLRVDLPLERHSCEAGNAGVELIPVAQYSNAAVVLERVIGVSVDRSSQHGTRCFRRMDSRHPDGGDRRTASPRLTACASTSPTQAPAASRGVSQQFTATL